MALKNGNVIQAKTGYIQRTVDTSAKTLFTLPAGAMIIGCRIAGTVSSGGSTGAVSVGIGATAQNTASDTDIVNALSVHAAWNSCNDLNMASGTTPYNRLSYPMPITALFSGDDSAGGDTFYITVEYL